MPGTQHFQELPVPLLQQSLDQVGPRGLAFLPALFLHALEQIRNEQERQVARGQGDQLPAQFLLLAHHDPKPGLPLLPGLPVCAPSGRERLLRLLQIRFRPQSAVLQRGSLRDEDGNASLGFPDELLKSCNLGLMLRRPRSPGQPGLQDRAVGDQPLDDVEAQQRFDGRPEGLAAALVLGQRADLLGVEEEQLRDVQRQEVLDQLRPVVRKPRVVQPVLKDPQLLAHPAVRDGPGPANVEEVVLTIGSVLKRQLHAGAFTAVDAVVDGLAQEVVVGQGRPFGAAGPAAVESQLDRIQQGRLAAAVDAAEQDDGQVLAAAPPRRQGEDLLATEQAEVPDGELLQDHSPVRSSEAETSTIGSSVRNSPAWRTCFFF